MNRTVLLWLISFAVLAVSVPTFAGDLVLLTDGRWLGSPPAGDPPTRQDHERSSVTVLEETFDKLVLTIKLGNGRGQRLEVATDRVREVFYWPEPAAWVDGVAAMEEGDDEKAIESFTGLAEDKKSRRWVRMRSYANIATIHEAKRDWKAAIRAWTALTTDPALKKSKLLPNALIQTGLAHLNLGDARAARKTFLTLRRVPGLPESWKKLAHYYLIFTKQRQGEIISVKQRRGETTRDASLLEEALDEYRALLDETRDDPSAKEAATLARLGIGACLLRLDRHDEALTYFQKLADTSDDRVVLGGAFNGLGQVYYRQQRWKDALMAFLRTEVLYGEGIPEQGAIALYHSGKCFQFLHGQGFGEGAYKERAEEQFVECLERYAGSDWAARSRESLGSFRGPTPGNVRPDRPDDRARSEPK